MVGHGAGVTEGGRDRYLVGGDALGGEVEEGGGNLLMLRLEEVGGHDALGEGCAVADQAAEEVALGVEVRREGHVGEGGDARPRALRQDLCFLVFLRAGP